MKKRKIAAVILALAMVVAYMPNVGVSLAKELPGQENVKAEQSAGEYAAGEADDGQKSVDEADKGDPVTQGEPAEQEKEKTSGEKADRAGSEDADTGSDGNVSGSEEPSAGTDDGTPGDAGNTDAEEQSDKQGSSDVLTAKDRTYKVTVTYDETAGIPEGSNLHVREISKDTQKYRKYLDKAFGALDQPDITEVSFARFFDVEIHDAAGNKIEPDAGVSVRIELADAPDEEDGEVSVVHFEKSGPVVMESETASDSDICFETESFSVYGILTTQLPQTVNDLDGWSFTLDRDGRYVTSNVNYNASPFRLGKSWNQSDAAVWQFEKTGMQGDVTLYNISTTVNGQKRYLHMGQVWNNQNTAHTTLETSATAQGCPQNFAVEQNNDGTYTIFIVLANAGWARYNLNEFDGTWGNGFAGYRWQDVNDHLHINFRTQQPLVQYGKNYAVIVKDEDNDKYYAVQNDGRLVEVEYDETTGRARVKMEYPFTWTYTSVWDGLDDNGRDTGRDVHPDWEAFNIRSIADARALNPGTQLADGYYYQYLAPGSASGMATESAASPSHDAAKWANGIRYDNKKVYGIQWNGSSYDNTGQYIGADFENMKIKGNVNRADAATIFFALIENVPGPDSDNETVSHIDIGIIGKASLEAPLAYGKYYDADGNMILEVTPDNDVTLELKKDIDITQKDIKKATLKAYDKDGNEVDDAFYITGYSANEHTTHSADQVRMEGSFKVDTLDPYDGWFNKSNHDGDRKAQRLENQIYYEVSTKKDVEFDLIWEGQQLYGKNGKPLKITTEMDVAADFSYWDENNECPPLLSDFEEKYPGLIPDGAYGHEGRNNEQWKSGAIIDNDFDTSYTQYGLPPYPGDSGMDFILTADVKLSDRILAVEVVKTIEDTEGNIIHPAEDVTNNFTLNYNKDADPDDVADGYAVPPNEATDLEEKQEGYTDSDDFEIVVGEDGTETYYDYNVEQGMFYVEEDSAPMAEGGENNIITDKDGREWKFKETRVETEYVWRNDDYTDKRHVVKGNSGVPEVLGEYEFDGWEDANEGKKPRNGFLEFYVYNVYEPNFGSLEITKEMPERVDVPGEGENATIAFSIVGKDKDGKEAYKNHAGMTFDEKTGAYETVTLENLPLDLEYTITEIYGGNYKPEDGEDSFTVDVEDLVKEDGKLLWKIKFKNLPDGSDFGSGIVNKYEYKDNAVKHKKEADE